MDVDPKRLSNVLSSIYAATVDTGSRTCLAHQIASAFDATSCLIHTREEGPPSLVSILGATENCRALLPSYSQYYYARDVWSERGANYAGRAQLGEDIVPECELVDSEWYNDLCLPFGIHHLVGAVFKVEQKVQGLIGVHRPSDAVAFENKDRTMMDLLIPHLKQSFRLLHIVAESARATNLTFEILGALSIGVIVVGRNSRVRLINAAAEQIVKANSGVSFRNGRLSLTDPRMDDRLRRIISNASMAPLGKSLSAGEMLVVRTGDGPRTTLMVVPLPMETAADGPLEPLVAVLVGTQSRKPDLSPDLIRTHYGLTPAESRVLAWLITGQSLTEYAKDAGLSINTVHSQAKSVFAKTGARRQSDLVADVMNNALLRIANSVP